ncbi:MAG: hypothetical protein ACREQ5_36880, partial [Candidatus Dormibacteria bacterium]
YQRAVEALGRIDSNHLFFLDNDMAGDLPTSVVPLHAPDLVYAPHVYTGSLIPPAFTGDGAALRTHVDELAREATDVPAALWFGEFSIDFRSKYGPQWTQDIISDFAAHDAGWAWWQWRESSGYGVRSYNGKDLDMPLLRALAQPFVELRPPGVSADTASSGDSLGITVRSGGAPIVIAWPQFVLGPPQVVSTCRISSVYDSSTARLVLTTPAGLGCTVIVKA